MLNFGERFTEDEIVDMVKQADRDRNGFIDFTEFVQMITNEEMPVETHRKLITSRKWKRLLIGSCRPSLTELYFVKYLNVKCTELNILEILKVAS